MKLLLALALAGCGVTNPTAGNDPATSPPAAPQSPSRTPGGAAATVRYRITAIPTSVAGGRTYASHAICAKHAVVGTADVTSSTAHAVVFDGTTVTDIGTLPGRLDSWGADGNAAGTVVGTSGGPMTGQGYVARDGVMSQLGGIGGEYTEAYVVNDSGVIAGIAAIPGQGDVNTHAVVWEAGCLNPTDLSALNNRPYSWPRDINGRGDVAGGDALLETNDWRAVVWRDTVLVELDDGGAPRSDAFAINDAGTVVGYVEDEGSTYRHPVVWQNGQMTDIGTLGGDYGDALGVNNRGDVVGDSTRSGNAIGYAFLYSNGAMTNLNNFASPGWYLGQAVDICDDGMIVGNGMFEGAERGFIMTPEP